MEAAITVGTPTPTLLVRHVLPNTIAPLIVQGTFICASAILIEAILSFLGIGIPPETPTWGNIMAEGRSLFRIYPHNIFYPGRVPGVRGARHQHAGRRSARHARSRASPSGCERAMAEARAPSSRSRASPSRCRAAPTGRTPIEDIRSRVGAGEIVCVVGKSGSGKSVTAQAVMGLLPRELARQRPARSGSRARTC